ncbi:MAG: flagella synthesis protein FlgN [Pseudomonadota bacterium]
MDTSPQEHLQQSLETSIRLAHQLEDALLDETRAVEARQSERLQETVQRKQALLDDLETETRQQQQWVEEHGEAFTPEGLARLFARLEGGSHLDDRWQALRHCVERCNTLNRGNATLIERDQRRVELSMQILRGEDGTPPTTYNPYGQAQTNTRSGRHITRA